MSSQTTNLHFVKPTGSENISRLDYNDNWDKTDDAYAELNGGISKLASGIAIMADGNTHQAIPAGNYVYVRNHDTLTERMYTANSAIAENATLSATNLTPVTNGGLNSLSGGLNSLSDQISTYAIGSISSLSALETAIKSALANSSNGDSFNVTVNVTSTFGLFTWTGIWIGYIQRQAADRSYAEFFYVDSSGGRKQVYGYISISGSSWYEQATASDISQLNDQLANVAEQTMVFNSDYMNTSESYGWCHRQNGIVTLNFQGKTSAEASTSGLLLANIPNGFKPKLQSGEVIYFRDAYSDKLFYCTGDTIRNTNSIPAGTRIFGTITAVCGTTA